MVRQGITSISSSGSNDNKAIVEIRVIMEKLHCSNQTLQDNILTLQQQRHEDNMPKDDEIMHPHLVSVETRGTPVPKKTSNHHH